MLLASIVSVWLYRTLIVIRTRDSGIVGHQDPGPQLRLKAQQGYITLARSSRKTTRVVRPRKSSGEIKAPWGWQNQTPEPDGLRPCKSHDRKRLQPKWQIVYSQNGKLSIAKVADCLQPQWQIVYSQNGRLSIAKMAKCLQPKWQIVYSQNGNVSIAKMAKCLQPKLHIKIYIKTNRYRFFEIFILCLQLT